jgi:hypothetical protein
MEKDYVVSFADLMIVSEQDLLQKIATSDHHKGWKLDFRCCAQWHIMEKWR